MELRVYLFKNRINQKVFAKELGISYATFRTILQGDDVWLSLALRIEELTNGEVTYKDLLSPEFLHDQKKRRQKDQLDK